MGEKLAKVGDAGKIQGHRSITDVLMVKAGAEDG